MPLKYLLIISICLLFAASAAAADSITLFRDGSILHHQASAIRGVIELPLISIPVENSLTVIPAPGTTILNVEIRENNSNSKRGKELEALIEQRQRLEDRLQALDTRETVFTSAARAQSGKAPRKTKGNPEPVKAIRQGTDFALGELEAVYTARRKTKQEIERVDGKISSARQMTRDSSIRITVTPAKGAATIRYASRENGWTPHYRISIDTSSSALLELSARSRGDSFLKLQQFVAGGALAEWNSADKIPFKPGVSVASYPLPLTEARFSEGVANSFSGRIANSSRDYLPPGEALLFRNGAFQSRFRFEGISSGRSRVITTGG